MSHVHIWEEDGVYRKYDGVMTGAEMVQASEEVEGHPRFDYIRYVINDFLDVTEERVDPQDIQVLAAIDRAASLSNPDIKIAVVATEQTLREMAVLYQEATVKSPYETRIFASANDARAWLSEIKVK